MNFDSPQIKKESEKEFPFTQTDFEFLSDIVQRETGIMMGEHKKDMLYSRLTKRLRVLGYKNFAEYCLFVNDNRQEVIHLINSVTTNLTSFFRESHHFDHLAEQIGLKLKAGKARGLRIWSAGCSSGQEPYSIAFVLKKLIGSNFAKQDIKILATDIDTNILDRAASGMYGEEEVEKIENKVYLDNFVKLDKGNYQVKPEIKEMIHFKQLNLLQDFPMKNSFDYIFCRNVIIYFDKPTQRVLFEKIYPLLKNDGYLYIGHSENLYKVADQFKLIGKTIYMKEA